ncbi:MAG: Spy/CpxP family protein refolding chaperone [Candidatus Aminicenantales bacterium]
MRFTKKRLMAYGIILLVAVNVTALCVLAYNRWLKQPSFPEVSVSEKPLTQTEEGLLLNSAQLEEMKNLKASFEVEIEAVRLKMEEKRKVLVEEMRKESPDSALIDRLIDEINHLQSEMQKKAVRYLFKERELLSPEQQKRFFEMFEGHVCPGRMTHRLPRIEQQPGLEENPICKD